MNRVSYQCNNLPLLKTSSAVTAGSSLLASLLEVQSAEAKGPLMAYVGTFSSCSLSRMNPIDGLSGRVALALVVSDESAEFAAADGKGEASPITTGQVAGNLI
jgi:hypothetical protein